MTSPILTRIRNLFAKANDAACTAAEAEAFAAKANELLLKHKLSPADLGHPDAEPETIGADMLDCGVLFGVKGERLPVWGQGLVNVVAQSHFCRLVRVTGAHMVLYGTPTDRAVVRFLIESLVRTAQRESGVYARQVRGGRRARNSFLLGFMVAVARRLRAMRAATEAQGGQHALVVLRTADEAVERFLRAQHPNLTKQANRSAPVDGSAFGAGKAAGDRAGINRPVGSGPAPRSRQLTA